jgi:peptidoglycan hydrolase-like protein with peptidoglycan-binding domain
MSIRRGALPGGLLLLASSFACAHAGHVDAEPGDASGAAAASPARRPKARPVKPGHPPLAAAPDDLFVPGAVERIQQALAERGYLALQAVQPGRLDRLTGAAVRQFQSDQGLARTGIPDHETVRRLGLDPDALFRKNPPEPGSTGSKSGASSLQTR